MTSTSAKAAAPNSAAGSSCLTTFCQFRGVKRSPVETRVAQGFWQYLPSRQRLRFRYSFGNYIPRPCGGASATGTSQDRVLAHLSSLTSHRCSVVSLPRRARSAPPATRTGHACAPHRDRIARRRAARRRAAARQAYGARRQHGQWEDDARPRDRRGHGVLAWLGGLHRRAAHARRTRLGASGRRRRDVDDPSARHHAGRLVRRRPAAQWRLRARRARRRAVAHARGGRASHTARARIERDVRRDGRSNGRRHAARRRGATHR